jgi:hypothetical protein
MIKHKCLLALILSLVIAQGYTQCLAPFTDLYNNAYVFDDGQSHLVEGLPLKTMQVGKNGMMYTTQNGAFKFFYEGQVYPIPDVTTDFFVTRYNFVYRNVNTIRTFYDRQFLTLETSFLEGTDSLYVSDSLIVWTNRYNELNVFHDGLKTRLELFEISKARIGENTFAYMDRNGNFKAFWHDSLYTLEVYEPTVFLCNKDMVMYVDQFGNYKFFYNGKIFDTSENYVNNFYLGRSFLCYINNLRQLTVYYDGEIITLLTDIPKKLLVKENLIVWSDKGNNTWCFYKGKTYWLERYIPDDWQADRDILVYRDINGRLAGFYKGEQLMISDQMVSKYNLYYETVTYKLQPYQNQVWCNKKTYVFQ